MIFMNLNNSNPQVDEFLILCERYLKTCIQGNGWEKSNKHFDICSFLCKYVAGTEEYKQEYGSLRIHIHELTSSITDRIEDIGFPIPRGYITATVLDEDIPRYAAKLAYRLIYLIDSQDKEKLLKLIHIDNDAKVLVSPKRIVNKY